MRIPTLIAALTDEICQAGSDHLPTFGGRWEGGYGIQQNPEELARLVCLLAAHGPFQDSLEIGIASGGTTRFMREHVQVNRTAVIDDGSHPRFPDWPENRAAIWPVDEFIGNSHSDRAKEFLVELGRRFDLVAIDGDHSAEGVRADWDLVQPFLAERAIVWFHDIATLTCPGVVDFWRQLRARHADYGVVLLETNALGIGVLEVYSWAERRVSIQPMQIAELIEAFIGWCGRHREPSTVRFYRTRLRLFRAEFRDRPAASLTSLEIDAFLSRAGEGWSDTTRRHNAVALTTLQNFALREGLLEKPLFRRLEKPRARRRERIPTPTEIAALMCAASPVFRLIYTGLAQSGARPGELCRAQITDVDWGKATITLLKHKTARKTGKARVIAIGKHFARTLRQAIGDRQQGSIFLGPSGNGWTVANLSNTHRRLRDRAGLPEDLVLYLARHRFGTEALRAGVPLKDVADLMGHASVTTTEIYLHRDVAELASNQEKVPEFDLPAEGFLNPDVG